MLASTLLSKLIIKCYPCRVITTLKLVSRADHFIDILMNVWFATWICPDFVGSRRSNSWDFMDNANCSSASVWWMLAYDRQMLGTHSLQRGGWLCFLSRCVCMKHPIVFTRDSSICNFFWLHKIIKEAQFCEYNKPDGANNKSYKYDVIILKRLIKIKCDIFHWDSLSCRRWI